MRSWCGLPYRIIQAYPDEKCLANIANLWEYFGRPPWYEELNGSASCVSAGVYDKRWGGLRKTLEVFLEWINSDVQRAVEPGSPDAGPALRFRSMKRDNFRCVACGRGPAGVDGTELHVQHAIPLSKGGKTLIENLLTLCGRCDPDKDDSQHGESSPANSAAPRRICYKACPDEVLLDEVRRVAKLVDKPVFLSKDFHKHVGNVRETYRRRFGGWKNVLERAGLGHLYSGWRVPDSDEALLAEVRRVAGLMDAGFLTQKAFARHSAIGSISSLRARFGAWKNVLTRAGAWSYVPRSYEEGHNQPHEIFGRIPPQGAPSSGHARK